MNIRWFEQLGELNPQLFREIKGRFNLRNLGVSISFSFLAQFCIYLTFLERNAGINTIGSYSNYCQVDQSNLDVQKYQYCPTDAINLTQWWNDYWTLAFMMLSVFAFFALIVIGTYMLIGDLVTEERRGTLNFIRLSPQSYASIFIGKILGVPSLLYLGILLFVPYHIWAGTSAGISPIEILSFYLVVAASCAFFYSFALLFGSITASQNGFQAWLGSGLVFFWLMMSNFKEIYQNGSDWLNLFCPSFLLAYFVDRNSYPDYYHSFPFAHNKIHTLKWFELPLGTSETLIVLFSLLNFGLWTFWLWQGLKRSFHNPNATLFTKQQTYWITGCFTAMNLGFLFQDFQRQSFSSVGPTFLFFILLFLGLIAALSPQRQTLQDWARYRRERVNGKAHLASDLIRGERSPSVVAIGLNLVIVIALFTPAILWVFSPTEGFQILATVLLNASLILLCASLVQLGLLTRTRKPAFSAAGMVLAVLILPLIGLAFLGVEPDEKPLVYLFSLISFTAVEYATVPMILTALVGQSMVTILLNLQLTRQLKKAGESSSKALLAGRV